MAFLGSRFHVVLLNDHVPFFKTDLKNLPKLLRAALKFRKFLSPSRRHKPLGLLGLNPHAGEGGLLGVEETRPPLLSGFSEKQVFSPSAARRGFSQKKLEAVQLLCGSLPRSRAYPF